ncbi:MAG TPA: hypothetical protein VD884_08350 [Ohtaekwangia sp.]|nr:hypothetical protein [Ohtaekwangia sp.]
MSILASCGKYSTSETSDDNGNSFTEFLSRIPHQSLPLELSCGLPDQTAFADDLKTFKEFIPKSVDRIFGTIKSNNESYKLVIFGQSGDDIYPVIFSFDNIGQVRDSLFLILHGCGGADDSQIPYSFISIDKNIRITLVDTTRFVHFTENGSTDDYVMDSLKVSRVTMRLDKNGRFEKD